MVLLIQLRFTEKAEYFAYSKTAQVGCSSALCNNGPMVGDNPI